MDTKTILYVGPEPDGVAIATGQVLMPGEPTEVDVNLAGAAPFGAPGEDSYQPGGGLLGKPDTFIEAE